MTHNVCTWLQAMQGLLVDWLERFSALLEPTDMEIAMWDEINLTLASMLAAGVSSSSAIIMRELGNAQSARLTAPRMFLIQTVYTHGTSAGCTPCVCTFQNLLTQHSGLSLGMLCALPHHLPRYPSR